MGNIADKFAEFAIETQFDDLPQSVVHEAKRVLLDSIGCAINGIIMERGRIAVDLAKMLGGPRESTIIGTGDKVACTNAAFANGELINALDHDALGTIHDTPILIAATVPIAERVRASGKSLIVAVALGFEISARIESAVKSGRSDTVVKEGPDRGNVIWSVYRTHGPNASASLAAAVGAGKILNITKEKMANAIGIAGYICPVNIVAKYRDLTPIRMTKYNCGGWGAQAGITAALLAEKGFTGDTEVFEGEYGFWRYTGYQEWNVERVLQNLGKEWRHKIRYKINPGASGVLGALDNFIQIVEKHGIQPDDIQEVRAEASPAVVGTRHQAENRLRTPDDYCYYLPYLAACAAYKVNPAHWHDPEVKQDPRIIDFLQRVKFNIGCDEKKWGLGKLEDPDAEISWCEIVTKGGTFDGKSIYLKGTSKEGSALTDEELTRKFVDSASRVLPGDKSNQVVQNVLELEKLGDVADLMEMVGP